MTDYQDTLLEVQSLDHDKRDVELQQLIVNGKTVLQAVMPPLLQRDFPRFVRMVMEGYRRNEYLHKCSPASVFDAMTDAFRLGLDPITPSLGQAYLVPYKNKATFQLGYRGMLELALRSDLVGRVSAGIVFPDDISMGMFYADQATGQIQHTWSPKVDTSNEAEIIATYAACWLKGQELPVIQVLNRSKIEARRERSQAYQAVESGKRRSSPWHTDFGAMARKSALRALFSMGVVPLSANAQSAIHHDEAVDEGRDEETIRPAEATVVEEPIVEKPAGSEERRGETITIDGETYDRELLSPEDWAVLVGRKAGQEGEAKP